MAVTKTPVRVLADDETGLDVMIGENTVCFGDYNMSGEATHLTRDGDPMIVLFSRGIVREQPDLGTYHITVWMERSCRHCADHPGWAHDESTGMRQDPQDTCRACFGSGRFQIC